MVRTTFHQGSLAFPEPSLVLDRRRYVVAVTNRAGDLRALELLDPAVRERVVPWVRIVRLGGRRDRVTRARVRDWARHLARAVPGPGLYLDVAEFDPALTVAGGARGRAGPEGPLLAVLTTELVRHGIRPVPLLRLDPLSSSATRDATTAATYVAGHGLGLVVPLAAAAGGEPVVGALRTAREELDLEPGRTDVLVEAALSPGEPFRPDRVAFVVDQVRSVAPWRNVILLTSSVPAALPRVVEPVLAPERANWAGWCELGIGADGPAPVFGDHGIRHPLRLTGPGPAAPTRANLRYTTADRTLIALGVTPGPNRTTTFAGLCRTIVADPHFAGAGCCWGCARMVAGATGTIRGWTTQEDWDTAGLVHHLTQVVRQLRALP